MVIRNGSRIAMRSLTLALLLAGAHSHAEEVRPPLPPLPHAVLQQLRSDPVAWQHFRAAHLHTKLAAAPAAPAVPPPLGWTPAFSGMQLSNPLLLTDGTVLAHVACTGNWYRLTPDNTGSYANGTWTATAPMPGTYSPLYFASGVLPDGRVIVEGGEYDNQCNDTFSTNGAIYDPQQDAWTPIAPPPGWQYVGDASSIVLADGRFMLANLVSNNAAILDPIGLTWTPIGSGKHDVNDEENWTLLPSGALLTVDTDYSVYSTPPPCDRGAELFSPATGLWTSAGSTLRPLAACNGSAILHSYEGPTQILQPDGKVQAFGATVSKPTVNRAVATAHYNTATGQWNAGPNMPQVAGVNYTMADAPAAVLPNGSVLIAASPSGWLSASDFPSPTHFFIFDGIHFTPVADVADSPQISSYEMNFLVLPSGEILAVESNLTNNEIFPAVCCANPRWAPKVTSLSSVVLAAAGTYTLDGTQLSGLTQGAVYGDDVQADTNFPLVRIVNDATGHVFYARTFGFGRSVAPGAPSSTSFSVPAGIEPGPSLLYAVANGIASRPVRVQVVAAP